MKTISKYLYVITFITFFLPFCTISCKKEVPAESTATDSVAVESPVEETNTPALVTTDSSINQTTQPVVDSSQEKNSNVASDSTQQNVNEQDAISWRDKIVQMILIPDNKNVSLWGFFYLGLKPVAVSFFFVLFVLSGIYRFTNKNENLVVLYSGMALVCLVCAKWIRNDESFVWGYWVMLGVTAGNFLLSLIGYLAQRRKGKG